MDRLVGLVDEELMLHFRDENLSTTLYASAWFITIFTSCLKQDPDNSTAGEHLLQAWDYFLCKGWRAIIKLGVYMLSQSAAALKELPFEDILPRINDCVKDVMCNNEKQVLYTAMKRAFGSGQDMTWHIDRLAREFEQSHEEVKSQPLKNKQI